MRRKWLRQPKTVAVGCDRLPEAFHGKEGVDGSSPSEGSTKAPEIGCSFRRTCSMSNVQWAWSPLWSLQDEKRVGMSSKPLPSRSASPDPDDAEAAIRSVAN